MAKIALGTWAWGAGKNGGDTMFGINTNEDNLRPVFDAAMDTGLNIWDTAAVYGMGVSEQILGSFIKTRKREDVLVSTKFTPAMAEAYGNSMERMAESSLKRLGTDYIDIYWIHNNDDVERWTPELIPLLKSGMVRRVGVCNHTVDEVKRVNEILGKAGYKLSAVQGHLSLLYRENINNGMLDYCRENGMEFWAFMVLEQGALSGKYNKDNPLPADSFRGKRYNPVLDKLEALTDEMREIGEKHGISCAQVATAWAVARGAMPLIGATKARHALEAADAVNVSLSQDEVLRLERLADATGVDTFGGYDNPSK